MKTHVIIHDAKDSVGVIVVPQVKASEEVNMWDMTNELPDSKLDAKEDIALGHKIALRDHEVGDTVFKYGHDIGKVVKPIKKGEHVHVHNVKTKRW